MKADSHKFSIIIALILFSTPLFSQTVDNVLLLLNEASPISMDVGLYYAQKRGIPKSNILRIKTSTQDTISREEFERQIDSRVAAWLARNFAQDRILYIVLTKGIPIKVSGTSGARGTVASVDSELTLLYRKMAGQQISPAGSIMNPYFLGDAPIAQAKQFSHENQDIYLVSRLDGYNGADIRGLIDRGFTPSKEGKIVLDAKGTPSDKGDSRLQKTAETLEQMGFKERVVFDTTAGVLSGEKQVLGYYSWGSNDPGIHTRHSGMEFVPGALAGMYVSSDGRTFNEPPADWKIGTWEDKNSYYAGSPQSMTGDLIRDGVTGAAGHVSEPYLEATIHPNILFPAYLSGFNLIESYYLAMPFLSWQTIVIGDPLCAPFRSKSLSASDIDKGTDPETELPALFSSRRLESQTADIFTKYNVHPDVIKLITRAETRMLKQDRAGARRDLEEAVSRDDRLPVPLAILANLYETDQEYDKAIECYRRVLRLSPDNPVALNNLAYALAVRKNSVREAVPLAEQAYKLAKGSPNVADTLGWIYYLTGQNEKALALLEEAARTGTKNAEIHLHCAIVNAALGNAFAAEIALKRALEIDPELERREEVKQLRLKLKP